MIDILGNIAYLNVNSACFVSSLNMYLFLNFRHVLYEKLKNMDYSECVIDISRFEPYNHDFDNTQLNYYLPFGLKIGVRSEYYECVDDNMITYYSKNQIEDKYNKCIASILSGDELCSIEEMKEFRGTIFYKVGYKNLINKKYGIKWEKYDDTKIIKKCIKCLIFPTHERVVCKYCSTEIINNEPIEIIPFKIIYSDIFIDIFKLGS